MVGNSVSVAERGLREVSYIRPRMHSNTLGKVAGVEYSSSKKTAVKATHVKKSLFCSGS